MLPNSKCFIPKNNPMFNVVHYNKLIDCAERRNHTEWNDWRCANPDEKILLEEAQFEDVSFEFFNLSNAHLKKSMFINVNLRKTDFSRANLEETIFECDKIESVVFSRANLTKAKFTLQANMKKAKFLLSNLESANLSGSILHKAELIEANLRGSFLMGTNFDGACLRHAILKKAQAYDASFVGAELKQANLEFASLQRSNFSNANFSNASLIKAGLDNADLCGAILEGADLRSTNLVHCKVNEATSLWRCFVDRKTDLEGIPLGSIKIAPGTRQLVEYNLRRRAWECWCREHKFVGKIAKLFWLISDYGLSTGRIVALFIITAVIFALIYCLLAFVQAPGIISNLTVDARGTPIPRDMILLLSIYFSIVTMTTLGFNDMFAEGNSITSHILLMLQVVFGYVMLGAIVTRFGILFTSCAPAGWFFDDFEEGKSKSIYWPEEELIKIVHKRET